MRSPGRETLVGEIRPVVGVIGACVLVVAGLWIALRPSEKSGITLETAPIERITIRNSVTATGTVEPVTEVEAGTQVSGIIDKLYADYNDVVKAGHLIAEMDKVTLQAELGSSQAELASCKTEYEYQLKTYTFTKTLHEKELVSDAEYDQAYYLYEKAGNAYEQAKVDIVGYATITSPIDGVVISLPWRRADCGRGVRDAGAFHHRRRPDADAGGGRC